MRTRLAISILSATWFSVRKMRYKVITLAKSTERPASLRLLWCALFTMIYSWSAWRRVVPVSCKSAIVEWLISQDTVITKCRYDRLSSRHCIQQWLSCISAIYYHIMWTFDTLIVKNERVHFLWFTVFLKPNFAVPNLFKALVLTTALKRDTVLSITKVGPIIRHISKTVQDRRQVTILFTNKKSHRAFVMALNDLERRNGCYFALFPQLGRVKHVTLVEVRHIVCDKNVAQRIY